MIRAFYLLSAALLVSACASSPETREAVEAVRADTLSTDIPSEGLPPQKLQPGQCGLFLWGMTTPRRFVFYTEATSGTALMLHDGVPLQLLLADTDGEVFGQFFTRSAYASQQGDWSVKLEITPGDLLEGGQRVQAGRLVTRGTDGWETVLPVNGIRACMPG